TAADPVAQAAQLWEFVDGGLLDDHERRVLRLSMLPVYVSHDEHMFIRVLQTFETTFALLALSLRTAITDLGSARTGPAVGHLAVAETALAESAPLFSLLATMQIESFRTFREYTEGASAIQSRNYKLVESLCRTPDPDRLDSSAYRSTPEVRERILAGQPTLDDACATALADDRFDAADRERLTAAMLTFASALRRWRQTHYRIAVRMLGTRSGTGYTEGTPYLSHVRTIPVFRSVKDTAQAGDTEEQTTTDHTKTENEAA
ncbi:tryptophan 2,3-dioxygenase, partial [Streptomyces sp. UH6]|nr:tryptophan 2,3-dioxygenase [Streptomyces sp. UH6]